ncbi:hypothetical protein PIB30_011995, partial [Stylosanthes scabra]|nr:hypothetical protein [Stylosanthes scabra]
MRLLTLILSFLNRSILKELEITQKEQQKSCSSMLTRASTPFHPIFPFIKTTLFFTGDPTLVSQAAFPHPKSTSYVGTLHQLAKKNTLIFSDPITGLLLA